MNIPSLSRRRSQPTQDTDGDGRIDERDGQPVVTGRDADAATYRSSTSATDSERDADAARRAADRGAPDRPAPARPTDAPPPRGPSGRVAPIDDETRRTPLADPTAERTVDLDRAGVPDREETRVVAGPKPRASLLATLGLIVSVAGALFVLTGTLAGYGIALGAVGAVLAVLGLLATRRRHVAGKTDALIGMLVGLAAVVLGVVALTGQFDWPTTDGDWVARLREWLDSQFVDRL
ncbi:DMT family transporter [Micromonospora halophytica]|uniref:DMT family transporter n=1 Tax=Micromonospora halophytica TaxID=47864 RepID=UPI001FDEDA31|nr:DMT family transporter [Micromonospora halophytica]